MPWNLSGFTIISFISNQSIAAWLSYSKLEISFSIVFSAALIVLSPEKFNKSVFDAQRYKSLICILNKSDPGIEPWKTPNNRILKRLLYCLSQHFVFVFLNTNRHAFLLSRHRRVWSQKRLISPLTPLLQVLFHLTIFPIFH